MSSRVRLVQALAVVSSFVFVLAACDDSSSSGSGSAGSGGSNAAGSSGSGGAAAGSAGAAGASTAKDQCQNTADITWLKASQPGGQTGRELAREKAGDCGLGCLNSDAPDKCALDCMAKEGVQLSTGCADCYGQIVLCTIQNCLPKCIDDPQAQICKDCQVAQGCDGNFYTCTGPLD